MTQPNTTADKPEETPQIEQAIVAVRDALARLRYGTVALTLHDGRIVQIEVSEKIRFQ